MSVDSLVMHFAQNHSYSYLDDECDLWYIGLTNSIDEGLNSFLDILNKRDQIIIEGPEIVDYLSYYDSQEISYVIIYKALPKLEYLEYKWKEKEDNNV